MCWPARHAEVLSSCSEFSHRILDWGWGQKIKFIILEYCCSLHMGTILVELNFHFFLTIHAWSTWGSRLLCTSAEVLRRDNFAGPHSVHSPDSNEQVKLSIKCHNLCGNLSEVKNQYVSVLTRKIIMQREYLVCFLE